MFPEADDKRLRSCDDLGMTDAEFQQGLSSLEGMIYREDFETALCDLYASSEPAHRIVLRQDLTAGVLQKPTAWRYPTAYFRSDLTREQRIQQLLIRMSIAGGSTDYREDLRELAYCYHSLLLLGLDADAIFETIAQLSDLKFGRFVRAFLSRPPENKSVEAFGLTIVQTPDGPVVDSL
ncbi:MAG: hypothetical protein JWP03_4188 [Phycisphaerales bacterium]|nr:hypothetical protein [Phycisphaerales bacterium]